MVADSTPLVPLVTESWPPSIRLAFNLQLPLRVKRQLRLADRPDRPPLAPLSDQEVALEAREAPVRLAVPHQLALPLFSRRQP